MSTKVEKDSKWVGGGGGEGNEPLVLYESWGGGQLKKCVGGHAPPFLHLWSSQTTVCTKKSLQKGWSVHVQWPQQ